MIAPLPILVNATYSFTCKAWTPSLAASIGTLGLLTGNLISAIMTPETSGGLTTKPVKAWMTKAGDK